MLRPPSQRRALATAFAVAFVALVAPAHGHGWAEPGEPRVSAAEPEQAHGAQPTCFACVSGAKAQRFLAGGSPLPIASPDRHLALHAEPDVWVTAGSSGALSARAPPA